VRVFRELLRAGEEFGIRPCGLGARNTLRLEAKMALYGHEIDASIRPPEADLNWIVKMDKGEFVGRAALERLAAGVRRNWSASRCSTAPSRVTAIRSTWKAGR
jgi:aminomethyltransferase